jgi:hypothetical protein
MTAGISNFNIRWNERVLQSYLVKFCHKFECNNFNTVTYISTAPDFGALCKKPLKNVENITVF